jgi:cytochrome oxidase Cu insertion factor (SCO1/SenC/PrrC family)
VSGTGEEGRGRADAGGSSAGSGITGGGGADPPVRRRRAQLVGLALFFFVPLGVSFYLYYGQTTWRPLGHVNHGVLISPARPVPALALPLLAGGTTSPKLLRGKWTLLYVESGDCLESCRKRLYDMRQVRTALDRDMDRVQRVFLAARLEDPTLLSTLHELHPDLIVAKLDGSAAPLIALLPGGTAALRDGRIYLIDPLGNLMMWYAADAEPKGLLEDMKRLLRLSSIG